MLPIPSTNPLSIFGYFHLPSAVFLALQHDLDIVEYLLLDTLPEVSQPKPNNNNNNNNNTPNKNNENSNSNSKKQVIDMNYPLKTEKNMTPLMLLFREVCNHYLYLTIVQNFSI